MAQCRIKRREQEKATATQPGKRDFPSVVNASDLALSLVDQNQTTPRGNPADPRLQPLPLAAAELMVAQDNAAPSRQPGNRPQQVAAKPLVGNQPLLGQLAVAMGHAAAYSALP